jgi:hypothetical protein
MSKRPSGVSLKSLQSFQVLRRFFDNLSFVSQGEAVPIDLAEVSRK